MAIKIPSKNIYEINNPKIRDNVIDNVSVSTTPISKVEDYDTIVMNQDISTIGVQNTFVTDFELDTTFSGRTYIAVASCGVAPYYLEKKIIIPRTKENKYISYLYKGTNKNDENNIKYSIQCRKYTGTAIVNTNKTQIVGSPQLNYTSIEENVVNSIPKLETSITAHTGSTTIFIEATAKVALLDETNVGNISIIEENENEYIANIKILCGVEYFTAKSEEYGSIVPTDPLPNNYTLTGSCEKYSPLSVTLTFYGDTIGIDLTDGSVTYGSGKKPHSLSGNELMQDKTIINYANVKDFNYSGGGLTVYGTESNTVVVNGTCVDPTPDVDRYFINLGRVNSSINRIELPAGNYVLKGMPQAVGKTSLLLTDLTGNEYVAQSFYEPAYFSLAEPKSLYLYLAVRNNDTFNNFVIAPEIKSTDKLLSENLANNVLKQYAKGKETATLLCSISDYFDYDSGEKVIDTNTNNMSLRLRDKVIPMIYGANGKDMPMSKNQNGTAKVFEVVGSNMIYDGAVWQELSLLEFIDNA